MSEKKSYNLKNSIGSLSIILSVIGVRLVNQYFYDMNIWIGLILVVILTLILYKIVDSIAAFDREITKKTRVILNIYSLAAILILFYTFTL